MNLFCLSRLTRQVSIWSPCLTLGGKWVMEQESAMLGYAGLVFLLFEFLLRDRGTAGALPIPDIGALILNWILEVVPFV
jgi:hypothetical protein